MKHDITLDEMIEKELQDHPELQNIYEEELLLNAISRMIVEMRRREQITQTELAKKAHTTQSVIARLESGQNRRMPSLRLLSKIAKAVNAKLQLTFAFGR